MNELTTKPEQLIIEEEGTYWTTSLIIADHFEKEHKHVLEAIENMECSDALRRTSFRPISYQDSYGRTQRMFHIDESGFMFLAMGFTGSKAARTKERFIAAFQAMRKELQRPKSTLEMLKMYLNVAEEHERRMSSVEKNVLELESKTAAGMSQTQRQIEEIKTKLIAEKINQFPENCMKLEEICEEIFVGITSANVSTFLKSIQHPCREYKYTDEAGKVHMVLVYEREGLLEARKRLMREKHVKKETPKNTICYHHAVGRFFIKRISHFKNAMTMELQ